MKSDHDCSKLFKPGASLSGLVYTMNGPLLNNFVTDQANELYTKKLALPEEAITEKKDLPDGQFVVEAVLMQGASLVTDEMYIAFHDSTKMPDFMANPLRLEVGNEYTIKLKARETMADPGLLTMPLEKRKCLFPEETDRVQLFSNYAMSGCRLECMIDKILKKCHCLPWDMLTHKNITNVMPCVLGQMECPGNVISSSSGSDCDCPLDCNSVKYSYSIQPTPWNPFLYCKKAIQAPGNNFEIQEKWAMFQQNLNDPFKLQARSAEVRMALCMSFAAKGVKLTISYADTVAYRTVKMGRVSFAGMLSTLGKLLLEINGYMYSKKMEDINRALF